MGLDVNLEYETHFHEEPIPKVVRPNFRSRSKLESRDIKGQHTSKNHHLKSLDGDFREFSLCNSPSPHRKSMPSRPLKVNIEDNLVLKRGSVYQSSSDVRRMRKLKEGRKKESAYTDEAFLSFKVVDSLPRAHRKDAILSLQQNMSPHGSITAESKSPSVDATHLTPKKHVEFLDLPLHDHAEKLSNLSSSCSGCVMAESSATKSLLEILSNNSEFPCVNAASELAENRFIKEQKSSCNLLFCPENVGNMLHERDNMHTRSKSFSEKIQMSSSPCNSEREVLKASPKARFSPLKRMFDPIMKSKSQRNTSLLKAETVDSIATDAASIIRNGALRKSLLNDFSKVTHKMEYDTQLIVSDQVLTARSSPAHLHAMLKLEFKHGAPSFEFSVKDLDDILSAKTWRTDSAFRWVYTFHSSRRKSNSTSRGTKARHGPSTPVVGQMQVSCYLCSEVSESGSLENYMATEFTLYDIAQARRSFTVEARPYCSSDLVRPPTITVSESLVTCSPSESNTSMETQEYQHSCRRNFSEDSDPSTSFPWSSEELHPHLQIAAIVIQIPFRKEKLRGEQREDMGSKGNTKLLSVSGFDHGRDMKSNILNTAVVNVVTTSGAHGLPNTEEGGPSSLLDRWRSGGGCDCGGWDMSCPIVVFDNSCGGDSMDCSIKGSQRPAVLFIQGRKENIPALSITDEGKGQYSVDFHAQLSSQQAFSICIAILHSSEASSAADQENDMQRLYSSSLELLLEAVAEEEEKRKTKKKVESIPSSFVLDMPFSPIGRV